MKFELIVAAFCFFSAARAMWGKKSSSKNLPEPVDPLLEEMRSKFQTLEQEYSAFMQQYHLNRHVMWNAEQMTNMRRKLEQFFMENTTKLGNKVLSERTREKLIMQQKQTRSMLDTLAKVDLFEHFKALSAKLERIDRAMHAQEKHQNRDQLEVLWEHLAKLRTDLLAQQQKLNKFGVHFNDLLDSEKVHDRMAKLAERCDAMRTKLHKWLPQKQFKRPESPKSPKNGTVEDETAEMVVRKLKKTTPNARTQNLLNCVVKVLEWEQTKVRVPAPNAKQLLLSLHPDKYKGRFETNEMVDSFMNDVKYGRQSVNFLVGAISANKAMAFDNNFTCDFDEKDGNIKK